MGLYRVMTKSDFYNVSACTRVICMGIHFLLKSVLLINLLFVGRVVGMGEKPEFSLHDACRHGDQPAVQWYIDSGCDLNVVDESGYAPIHRAVFLSQFAIVKQLITSNRVDINIRNVRGGPYCRLADTALLIALEGVRSLMDNESASMRTLQLLLDSHVALNIPDSHGETSFFRTCFSLPNDDVKDKLVVLLKAGANPNLCNSADETVFAYACRTGNKTVVKFLSL